MKTRLMNFRFCQKTRFKSRLSVFFLLLLSGIFLLFLTGCVTLRDIEASQEQSSVVVGVVDAEHSLGQTFVSRRGRLNGFSLWLGLAPDTSIRQGELIVRLFHTPQETIPIRQIQLPFRDIALTNPVTLTFPPLADPPGQTYFLSLQTLEGRILVYGRDIDIYPQGNAYLNDTIIPADIAFRLTYEYNPTALTEDLLKYLREIWLLLPLSAVLILPGWTLLDWLNIRPSGIERISLSLGLSLSLIPLVMTWTSWLGITWQRDGVLIAFGLLGILALRRLWERRAQWKRFNIHHLALAAIFLLALVTRLIMVRDLSAPPWVDSVHHGVITRLILEQGQIPETYEPYLDVNNARYHPGYHTSLATFTWLSALELPQAMLIFGQVLNALMILAIYQFAFTITQNSIAGLMAALITGMVTPMPAYYTSWGRYTQLTGLLILPTCLALIHYLCLAQSTSSRRLTESIRDDWKIYFLAGIACAGLFLVHYRVAAFLACLLAADFVIRLISNTVRKALRAKLSTPSQPESTISPLLSSQKTPLSIVSIPEIGAYLTIAIISFILLLPWLPSTTRTLFLPKLSLWQGSFTAPLGGFSWNYLTAAWGKYSLYAAGIGALWAIFRRERFPITLILWIILMFVLANLGVWRLPGSGFINSTSVAIALFIPISTLGGYFVAQVYYLKDRLSRYWLRITYLVVLWCTIISLSLLAARQMVTILNPITFLFRQADYNALNWIADHIPPEETVVINPFAWGYGLYAGNDGGYWITPLTGRKSLPPPVLFALSNDIEKVKHINTVVQQIMNSSGNVERLSTLMRDNGLNYLYIGKRGGLFSPRLLKESHLFQIVYEDGGTWVFRLR